MNYLNKNNLEIITQKKLDKLIDKYKERIEKEYESDRKRLNLFGYNLSNIKIKNKDLQHIIISDCLLNNVTFEKCDLKDTDIRYSEIINVSFINCDFSYGYFYKCNFINSDLSTCNIKNSHFAITLFTNTTMPDYPIACPEKGSFIGYKKVCSIDDCFNDYSKYYILKLEIPEDAKRSSAASSKCRCDKVKVLEIQNLDGSIAENITKAESFYNDKFIYELGKIAEESKFDECRWNECTAGIHFFMKRKEAVNY